MEIELDRADSMLQRRFVGDVKTVSTHFLLIYGFVITLQDKKIKYSSKNSWMYSQSDFTTSKHPSLGNSVTLRKNVDTDVPTLSDEYISAGDDLRVVYSQYS